MFSILVVDDRQQDLYLLRTLLQGNGFRVETATNGQEALVIARKAPPDLIISDILMPVMDGFTLCREWMKDAQLQTIPFIFYSATYTEVKDAELAAQLGAARFIVKPAEPDTFIDALRTVINEFEMGQIPPPPAFLEEEDSVFLKLYNERLVKRLEHKMTQLDEAYHRLATLYRASTGLAVTKPLNQLLSYVLHTIVEAMGYDRANYFAFEPDAEEFYLVDSVGFSQELHSLIQRELVLRMGAERGLVGLVGQTRQYLIVDDTQEEPRWITLDGTVRSALFMPVLYKDSLLGVACILSTKPNAFSKQDAQVAMTLANNVAIAIDNAQLYEAQQRYAGQLEAEVAARTAELQVALEQAQTADKMKSRFVSNMNHELRTPLTVIKLYLSLLDHGRPDNWERYVGVLKRETERLQIMVEEVLDLSRLDLGRTTVELEPVDLNYLIGGLITDRGELAATKGLTLDFEPGTGLPLVLADQRLLFQVLTNLLANAINYTHSGGITMCTATAVADAQTWVTASITDTGPGISDEDKAHLFDRFYRGEAGQESSAPGTGLGLAICREIMNRHGGQISVESAVNEGSTFTIWLQPEVTTH